MLPPRRPDRNAFVERYHRSYDEECLQVHRPADLAAVITVTERYQQHYNRHTAATLMLGDGIPLVTVSKMPGHFSPAITANIYAHALDEAKSLAIASLSKQLKKDEA